MPDWAEVVAGRVLFEDDTALVLDKPAGISVTGERHDTDLVRLAREAGVELFPAHRIDKVTSGAVLFAKQLAAHGDLTRQFNKRVVDKAYLALVRSPGELPESGTIDLPLSVGRKNRVRIAAERGAITRDADHWSVAPSEVFGQVRSYPSSTAFATVWRDDTAALLTVRPLTGRRHQIRVHLAWIGHEILGDPLFDKASGGRTGLHSWRLGFTAAWLADRWLALTATPGADFRALVGDRLPDDALDRAEDALTLLGKGTVDPSIVDDGEVFD